MQLFSKVVFPALLLCSLMGINQAAYAVGKATVTGQLATGFNGTDCGAQVKISAVVTENTVQDPGGAPYGAIVAPRSASFRVYYTTDSLTFDGVEGVLLNSTTSFSPQYSTIDPCRVYRIVRASNPNNTATTGTLLNCVFTLNSNGYKPYSVEFADDVTTNTPLIAYDWEVPPWINEIHYDNTGSDTNEGVEFAGLAGTFWGNGTLGYNWYIEFYNTTGTYTSYSTISGSIPNQQNGYGTTWLAKSGMVDGPGGVALVYKTGQVFQFLSYEGSFVGSGGDAAGITSVNIGVSEASTSPAGQSLQLGGSGSKYSDFTWNGSATATRGALNNGQTFTTATSTIFNGGEFDMFNDYDNTPVTNIGSATTTETACGLATVATEVVTSGCCQFIVNANVVSNMTGQAPQAFGFKVFYDAASVSYDGCLGRELGATIYVGAEQTVSGTLKSRRISTLGNPYNTNLLPSCVGIVFHELVSPNRPYTISVQGDNTPGAVPLISTNTFKSMYVAFDNTATQNYRLMPPCAVPDWKQLNNPSH